MSRQNLDFHKSLVPPIYNGIAFEFDSVEKAAKSFKEYGAGYAYGRMGNPTVTELELFLAKMEGVKPGSVWCTNSGLSALALLCFGLTASSLGLGKRIVTSSYIYGGSFHQLQLWRDNHNLDVTFVDDPFDLSSWERAIKPGASFVFLETPTNPTIDIFDISAIASIAHKYKAFLIVDNTVAVTLQKPLTLGADAVLYSVTKALNRQSTGLGGAIVASDKFLTVTETTLDDYQISLGSIMNPFSAYFTLLNRTTLSRDMRLFSENAFRVAYFLSRHPKIKKVNYPFLCNNKHYKLAVAQMEGGSGLLSFEMESFENAKKLVESLHTAHLAPHLGDENHNLIIHPASTTHSELSEKELLHVNITPELVRLSVSLGDMSELINDLWEVLNDI